MTLVKSTRVVLLLALALAGCSSSKPMSPRVDAALSDAAGGNRDSAADLAVVTDSPPPPADAPPGDDVPADLGRGRETSAMPDAPAADRVAPADLPLADSGDGRVAEPPDGRTDVATHDARDLGSVLDLGGDVGLACTPGMDQTCNDDALSSSLWGSCTAEARCVCKAGFDINPATGRCRPAPRDAAPDSTVAACTGELVACGCGCCGGSTPTAVCYYPTLGETTEALRAADEEVRGSTNCALAGCSRGDRYVCCHEGAPEPPGSATYVASGYIGDLNHLIVQKLGADCAVLELTQGTTTGDDRMALATHDSWRVARATLGGCADASPTEPVLGVVGSLAIRKVADGCAVDVHASLFAYSAQGEVRTTRLDADGVPIGEMGKELCRGL